MEFLKNNWIKILIIVLIIIAIVCIVLINKKDKNKTESKKVLLEETKENFRESDGKHLGRRK